MSFKNISLLFINCAMILLMACSDAENETNLVNLHTLASQDIVSINFPADLNESIVSISSEFDYVLQGVKSNNVDTVTLVNDVVWSLSDNALSTIDQQGHFIASSTAEFITLSAQFGPLIETFDIKVSDAKFDEIVQLSKQSVSVEQCQSQIINPVARYIDSDGNDEIRLADSNIINTITWIIRNQEDNSASQRAHINASNNQTNMHSLASGGLLIQAKALSVFTGTEKTSADFSQSVGSALNSIKICNTSDIDLAICNVTTASVEKDNVISLISVGNYQAADGSNFNQIITQNSKWGIDNISSTSIAFASDLLSLNVSGLTESSSASLSVACGTITQSITGIDITKGVTLGSKVSCDGILNCLDKSAAISVSKLSVTSLSVSESGDNLTDNVSTTLNSRPAELTLKVTANFVNSTSKEVTTDTELVYSITEGDGTTIEDKANTPGVFTVLGAGTAKIKIDYREETFIAYIIIP